MLHNRCLKIRFQSTLKNNIFYEKCLFYWHQNSALSISYKNVFLLFTCVLCVFFQYDSLFIFRWHQLSWPLFWIASIRTVLLNPDYRYKSFFYTWLNRHGVEKCIIISSAIDISVIVITRVHCISNSEAFCQLWK